MYQAMNLYKCKETNVLCNIYAEAWNSAAFALPTSREHFWRIQNQADFWIFRLIITNNVQNSIISWSGEFFKYDFIPSCVDGSIEVIRGRKQVCSTFFIQHIVDMRVANEIFFSLDQGVSTRTKSFDGKMVLFQIIPMRLQLDWNWFDILEKGTKTFEQYLIIGSYISNDSKIYNIWFRWAIEKRFESGINKEQTQLKFPKENGFFSELNPSTRCFYFNCSYTTFIAERQVSLYTHRKNQKNKWVRSFPMYLCGELGFVFFFFFCEARNMSTTIRNVRKISAFGIRFCFSMRQTESEVFLSFNYIFNPRNALLSIFSSLSHLVSTIFVCFVHSCYFLVLRAIHR